MFDKQPDKQIAKTDDFLLDDSFTDMMMMMVMIMLLSLVSSQLASSTDAISQQVSSQSYEGINDPRWVDATQYLSYVDLINEKPYKPWMIAFIVNYGPDPVNVAINYPAESFMIESGGTRTINRSGAQERMNVLFFRCEAGQRARVSVTGEY